MRKPPPGTRAPDHRLDYYQAIRLYAAPGNTGG
jgi:hypothetical protein